MFNKIIAVLLFVTASCLVFSNKISAQTYTYVGVKNCACHNPQIKGKITDFWKSTKHSQSYKSLLSDKAKEISKDKAAVENEKCLKCHVGNKALAESNFKEDGVQCETCHGPGSGYKALSVMKSHEESVKKGLAVHENLEKYCITCHNQEGHPQPEFKFEEMWKSIKHGPQK